MHLNHILVIWIKSVKYLCMYHCYMYHSEKSIHLKTICIIMKSDVLWLWFVMHFIEHLLDPRCAPYRLWENSMRLTPNQFQWCALVHNMMVSWHGNAFHITGPLGGKSTITGGFPSQRASNDLILPFLLFLNKLLNKEWSCGNHIHTSVWDAVTHSCPYFKGSLFKLLLKSGHGWVIVPTVYWDIIPYPCPNLHASLGNLC